jgi:hypothetical protein
MPYRDEASDLPAQVRQIAERLGKLERGDQFGGSVTFGRASRVAAGIMFNAAGGPSLQQVSEQVAILAPRISAGARPVNMAGRYIMAQAQFNLSAPAASRVEATLRIDGITFANRFCNIVPGVQDTWEIWGIIAPTVNTADVQLLLEVKAGALADSTQNRLHHLTVFDVGTTTE